MLIGEFLNKNKLSDTIIKSIVWNTIIDIFDKEKNIDLSPYLVSIKIMGKTVLIKTTKPLINSELILLNETILKKLIEKFTKLNFNFEKYEIKYN